MTDPGLVEERRQFTARIRDLEQRHAALIAALDALVKEYDVRYSTALHASTAMLLDRMRELLRQDREGHDADIRR